MVAQTGAERVAASRERARKAEGYDAAVAEAEQLREEAEKLRSEHAAMALQLQQFQEQQIAWVQQSQAVIAEKENKISVLGQQLAQLRAQLVPLAQSAPAPPAPGNFFRVRCPRCQGPVDVPRGNNHVIAA